MTFERYLVIIVITIVEIFLAYHLGKCERYALFSGAVVVPIVFCDWIY